jgi:hypothetical protein
MNDDIEASIAEQAQTAPAQSGAETTGPQSDAVRAESEIEGLGEPPAESEEYEAEGTKPKRPSGAQRLKRRNQALLAENAELLRRLEESSRGAADVAPRPEDFNGDAIAYERARSVYEARQAVRDEFRRREETELAGRYAEAQREEAAEYEERLTEARARIPDFDETLNSMKGAVVRDDVIDEIMASDKGPLIAYHLAKDRERLLALNNMTSRELAREVGRLEGAVRMPASNRQTRAPAPLSVLRGGAAQRPDLRNRSPEEYRRLREGGIT